VHFECTEPLLCKSEVKSFTTRYSYHSLANRISEYFYKEKHKLVHTIYRSLDRESNPRPLAYGNTVVFLAGIPTRPQVEWVSGFLDRETHETAGRVGLPGQENHSCDVQPIDHQIIYNGFSMIFCHSFVSDVILRRFFTKPRLILACDKKYEPLFLLSIFVTTVFALFTRIKRDLALVSSCMIEIVSYKYDIH
jgi:hypothetical protein